jgi:glycosyltransferase involved in cell wall biosynthesis
MGGNRDVVVLLPATGRAPYLLEQLRSIAMQTWTDIRVVLLLNGYSGPSEPELREVGANLDLTILSTPDPAGLPAAFFDLISYAAELKSGSYFAFCDQDDVWYSDKIEVAVQALENCEGPTLWASAVDTVDALGQRAAPSVPLMHDWPSGVVAVQCMAPGCAMVFNERLLVELAKFTDSHQVVMHDWLACSVASLVGRVVTEPRAFTAYRIHSGQSLGIRDSLLERSVRFVRSAVGTAPSMESQARELKRIYGSNVANEAIELVAVAPIHRILNAWLRGTLARSTTTANALLPARLLAGRLMRLRSAKDGRAWLRPRNLV